MTGGKGILILAICPDVPESYFNVKTIFDHIKLLLLKDFNLTGDLKIINIECGIGTHSSMFPCPFCLTFKDKNGFWVQAELRTWKSIIENYENWVSSGSNPDDLKHYKNCSNPPMIGPGTDEPVLWTISPPALHIYLGANHILKSLQKQWGYLVPWLKEVLHIVFAPYHGETLEGNDLAKVLANLEKLSEVVPEEFAEYLHCLACFKEVTNACLTSKQLSNNYQEKITEFSESVYALKRDFKMTISNKMHILISDVPRFIDKVKRTFYKQKDIYITNC